MSSGKLEISTEKIPDALRALRGSLGLTFEGMARLVGCTSSAYFRWETGRRVPSGDWLLTMMRLCPDQESLAAFGLAPREARNLGASVPRRDGYYKVREDLEKVLASGQSQLINQAEELLDRLAEKAGHMTHKVKSKK